MVAETEKGLQKLNETAKQYDMKINIKKTKIMKMTKNGGEIKIIIDDQIVKQLNEFRYLGASGNEK